MGNTDFQRRLLHCPANQANWNRDDFLTWPNSNESAWGYAYIADDGGLTWTRVWPPPWDTNILFTARALTDPPHFRVV